MTKAILIIEDDITFGMMLKTWLEKKGFQVSSVSNIARAQKQIDTQNVDLILSDLRLPDHDGIHLLQWMIEKKIKTPLIIMTGYADIQSAVQAIKLGAKDYIAKPVNPEELLRKINEALLDKKAPKEQSPTSPSDTKNKQNFLEGESDAAKQLYNYVGLVAPTNMSVLIIGASGTGKEYVAQRIHQLSKRNQGPFIAIDCGAIPKELAASEFFGHIKGSFTGAIADKDGAFVAANGGTLFLDEIGNLSYETQVQLLRALQERKIRPMGSNEEITVDIRLVAATNENLEEAIETGNFREDLFHRINEFTLRIPNLKDRKEDILLFANFFLDRANKELNKQLIGFDAKASSTLQDYHWPGNLRQMKNVIKRATLLAQGNFITPAELASELSETSTSAPTLSLHNEENEKERILEALRQSSNNKSKAAQMLGVDRKTLYNKLKLYDIKL
ncbi:sigma-54-dependent transcriptional regulator [Bacteroides ihuae]|uniref:sigma-54-dependent transcriptional regulator n=1 Tax=Bacteroides ihuae TaxID=1852362 RepID=UPI0008D9DE6A|nr:sigma-54 dependent transcriptional regulator [Bacteroides ihuae]